jgi:E3 ubiquitin-protein ligase DOA10
VARGSVAFVHEACLLEWLRRRDARAFAAKGDALALVAADGAAAAASPPPPRCEVCLSEFRVRARRPGWLSFVGGQLAQL